MLKRLTAACLLSFAGLGAAAQLPDSADMSAGGEFRRRIDRHTSTKAYRMLFVGTPLIVGGVVMQAYDSDFRRLRNGYSRIADKGVGPGEPGVPERPDTLVKGECPVFAELQVNRSGQGRTVLPAGQHPAVVVRLVLTALVSAAADNQQSRGRHGKKAQSDFHTQGRPAPGFRKDGLQI